MFSDNRITVEILKAPYQEPDDRPYKRLVDYEKGGTELNQAYTGINKEFWVYEVENNSKIYCYKELDPNSKTLLYTGDKITEVIGSFDRNMAPHFIFREDGTYKFHWYDTIAQGFSIMILDNVRSPKICHDDKRDEAVQYSDLIITYIRNDAVYFKLQRDRYLKEYVAFTEDVKGRSIQNFGMNKGMRLQWTLVQSAL